MGYLYFAIRLIPGLNKILKPSDKRPFCSDLTASCFEGDKSSAHPEIRQWDWLYNTSTKSEPNSTSPGDQWAYVDKEKIDWNIVTLNP